jgi:hypothetical protein
MPKTNAYSRDNVYNTLGFIDLHISYLNQPVLDTSSPTFQNVNVVDDVVIGGDLFVSGNATISGNTTVIATDIVEIKDNIVLINSEETSSGVTLNLAGVEVERGSLPNFQSVFEESSDLYKIGEVGNLQAVATRQDTPLDKGVMVYNQSLSRLDSVTTIELPITFSDTTVSTNSNTGSVKIAGSIAISNTANATNSTTGGSFTTAGGLSVAKDSYIGGALDVNGITTLDQTTIDTSDGIFSVSGANAVSMITGSTNTFRTTSGNINITSDIGNVTIDSATGISIDSAAASNFSTSVGTLTLSGIGLTLNANAGTASLDSNTSILIGTNVSGTPISVGTDLSTILLNGDFVIKKNALVINALPQSSLDTGYLIKRYQPPNNSSTGDLLNDTPLETSTFSSGSTTSSVVLNATANATDNYYNGMWITCGAGQVRRIKDYNGTTKTALLYITADNTSTFTDGLDLVSVPTNGTSYSIYNKYYQSVYYNESVDEFRFVGSPLSDFTSTVIDYTTVRLGDLNSEGNIDVAGNLNVTGTISAGITVPSITVSNIVNIVSTPSTLGIKLFSNGNQRELTVTFRMTTSSVGLLSSFEFTVPGIATFSNVYDIVPVINAFSNDADPVNLENTTGFCVVSTNRAKIKFTSGSNSSATVQVIVKYNV